jgi:hypothetical protein
MIDPGKRGQNATIPGVLPAANWVKNSDAPEKERAGLHVDAVGHPGHLMGLAVNCLTRIQINFQRLQSRSVDDVLHSTILN